MKRPRWGLWRIGVLGLCSAAMAVSLPAAAPASSEIAARGPTVRLVASANEIVAQSFDGAVILDPGIYVASLGSALQLDIQRASYTKPVTIAQVIHLPGGRRVFRQWPSAILDGFNGLRDFVRMTVTDAKNKVVASSRDELCPNSGDPQRAVPNGAQTSPYPLECGFDPFPKSLVMGIATGWGVDSFVSLFHLAPGKYKVTVSVTFQYVRLLHIARADASASVNVTVVDGNASSSIRASDIGRSRPPAPLPGAVDLAHARATGLAHTPGAALPDLIPLPAWQIGTTHTQSGRGQDLLNFAATVWVSGNAPLDVEGFRVPGTPVMSAYQYFWRNGHVIGRARVGTMGFAGYNHWHFEQFAQYTLLNSAKRLAVRSRKEGFCITPTDPVDLLAPQAVWQPLAGEANACGQPTALSAQEILPVGWGDTYSQSVPGESFDITKIPNGTYYIEVTANPLRALHELDTHNDVSLRQVILGGTAGDRTVKVPAWHGIDREN